MSNSNIDKFIRVLRELGFTAYESKVLACLSVRRESLKVNELSVMADLPRTKVYSVISSLNGEGFVKVHSGRPLRVSAPPPNELASLLTERVIEDARARLNMISKLYSLNLDEGLWLFERSIIPREMRALTNIDRNPASLRDSTMTIIPKRSPKTCRSR